MVAPEEGTVIDNTVVEEFGLNQWRLFATIGINGSSHIKQWRSNDGENWLPATSNENLDTNIGAPVISEESISSGCAIEDNGLWDIAYAESIDGDIEDFGVVINSAIVSEMPPSRRTSNTDVSLSLRGRICGVSRYC